MKAPNSALYETLTPRQRVIATIEAEARGDDQEVQRLVKTCPKKNYTMTDAAYTDTMNGLVTACMTVECELRGLALAFLMGLEIGYDNPGVFLQKMANLHAAWHQTLEKQGFPPDLVNRFADYRHPALDLLFQMAPPPDPEAVAEGKKHFRKVLEEWGE